MPPISVVICCANVADTLEAACRSAAWADELIVVDSGSTDATEQIGRRLAGRYLVEPWRGYTEQKRFGASLARNAWVLVLDGDEEITPELAAELRGLTDQELQDLDVLLVRRQTYVMGRRVRAFWPDWQSRLIHKERAHWAEELFHDDRLPSQPSRVRKLRGRLLHRRTSQAGFADFFAGRQLDDRLPLIARQMYQSGKRCHGWDLIFRPPLTFWKFYLIKGGFRDGLFGLMIAQRMAISAQLKYAALWAYQRDASARTTEAAGKPSR